MAKVTRLTSDAEGGLDRKRIHLREISGDLDAPLEAVGQDLRAARLRRGDDLATVSRVLKIRKDHLEALEEDRIGALPGRTYAVGFVRSYADYLGLDAVQCVERFKAEIAGRTEDSTPHITVIEEDENRRMPQGWKIVAGVVVILVLYGAYQLAASADRMLSEPTTEAPPQQYTQPVAKHVTPPRPPMQLTVTQPSTGTAETVANAAGQPQTASQTTPPAPAATTAAAPGAVTPPPAKPAAEKPNAQKPVVEKEAAAAPAPAATPLAPLPQGQVYGERNKNARVILRARQATRILVQGPNGVIFINRTLKPGDSFQVPNLVGVTLTTSNAGGVEVDLDGLSMGLVGKNQDTAEALSLDPQAIMDRYNGSRGG